jgi:hypothetical protein
MSVEFAGNQPWSVTLGCRRASGRYESRGDNLLHGAVEQSCGGAIKPANAQCGETTYLQEIATTMTRIGTGLRVSAIADVKIAYEEFGRTACARRDLFGLKGTIVPNPAVDCGGKYCVASWQTDREVVENDAWCGFGTLSRRFGLDISVLGHMAAA